ncbi:origin recognition complex subunit 1 isoform X5 [Acyrthosiphon pisum]|uniref:Origin recognition complex subunit 1 n=1 Tax=Acyrthosiphon pisum TaxID=7029 RepID=A0A8R2HAD9_ACYPI|nr:origin recognition complex subunit 1 isoform X5 [Acyrthosiphon pisum]|eukprot:XP_016663797.1 PREDICTED: origin recognition complex subunit 1 isoform X5 [Acyrthosiphon pisum]
MLFQITNTQFVYSATIKQKNSKTINTKWRDYDMVDSPSENSTSPCTRQRLKNGKPTRTTNRRFVENTILHLCEFKLNIKRVDESNYVSTLSPRLIKMTNEKLQDHKSHEFSSLPATPKTNSRKTLRWSERHDNDLLNLVEEAMNEGDSNSDMPDSEDEILNMPKTRSRRISESSMKSNEITNTPEAKRLRKPVDRFGNAADLNDTKMLDFSSERKRKSQSVVENINTPKSKTNGRNISIIDEDGDSTIDILKTPIKTRSHRVSESSFMKSNDETNTSASKRLRKPVDRFGYAADLNETKMLDSTPERKRTRQSIDENINTPKSNKKGRKISITDEDENADFDNVWKTPTNRHLRQSITSRSGSKVRRSILRDIPENKEIEISTPKTPRKTPKTHVKNLTASASKRLDSGAKIPCSPLEKARANLHLHAAPKHLPCREVEYKSIHSFLVRKINDELTGSMYISGVPGTGKTATVKRVIDSLNADLLMKHSFKFVEINGLRLANPHQAFSVIWKELTAETVSSSRAQTLLNDHFSNKKVKELSTILLVDEVDHICNRKQDVVYNILDWPSQTGSKVVVITIANTMDLPERVLRGCVTSRMGLTRLVFKPYTFQQLQEIIMNRLIGNSSFDPDAVQLVARKVAAISGDARRALDICRRAIDLVKSEDESQLITINHVNQVLNAILSGVRVTAIRCCCLFEQFFLRALRDVTSSTGIEHSTIDSVYTQLKSICLLEGEELPNEQQVLMMAYRLRDSGLIFLEKKRWDIFRKVSLNVSPEDISYALDKYND